MPLFNHIKPESRKKNDEADEKQIEKVDKNPIYNRRPPSGEHLSTEHEKNRRKGKHLHRTVLPDVPHNVSNRVHNENASIFGYNNKALESGRFDLYMPQWHRSI